MKKLLCILSLTLFAGCATISEQIEVPPPLEFDRTEYYNTNLSEVENIIEESVSINVIYAKEANGEVTIVENEEDANMILMRPEEYAKVADLAETSLGLLEIAEEQGNLINKHIENVNHLKELAEIERQKLILSTYQWKSSEELLEREHKIRVRENIIHNIRFFGTLAGLGLVVFGI